MPVVRDIAIGQGNCNLRWALNDDLGLPISLFDSTTHTDLRVEVFLGGVRDSFGCKQILPSPEDDRRESPLLTVILV